MKRAFFATILMFTIQLMTAQIDLSRIELSNRTYVSGIESISFQNDTYGGEPVIVLGGKSILFSFDDLEEESRYLKYTILHCTHDWQVSDLPSIEYINGFTEDLIDQYDYSFNTIQHYMHYSLAFPNDNLQPTKSGNYILFVYDDTPDNPILTRRFMVLENELMGVTGDVHSASDITNRFTHQEVDFSVNTGRYTVRNPAVTLHATIKQNGRWDNAIYGLTYRSGSFGELSFDYDDGRNVFPGSAEFRTFDIRSLRINGDRIVSINFAHRRNHAYVLQDDARPFGAYESRSTMHGACVYRNLDMSNPFSEDYVYTHFTLKSGFPFTDGDVYVFGQLTDWQLKPDAKLKFNPTYNFWETDFPIKQGVYNYQYVYVPHGTSQIDATYVEGSHYETNNIYNVYLYFREEGGSYDKLVGMQRFATNGQ